MHWFQAIAPIRLKLLFAFSIMTAAPALVTLAALVQGAWIAAGIGLLATGAAAAFGIVARRSIADPYVTTVERMEALAAGDLDQPIRFTEYQDCVGRMTRAMFTFRDTAKAQRQITAEQAEVVRALGESLAAMRDGDLTVGITVEFPPETAVLKENFNEALDSMRQLISSVLDSTSAIRTGSSEIATASEHLAQRTESAAASLERTTSSITTMDTRLKATAEAASRTEQRADGAIRTVSGGRAIADEAVQAMGRVSQSAKGIDAVIEGLDKIAFQTRVLAMNAAVEAGRAGDAGRGFAVVADLVSALAMRAEEEAKSARDQLTITQADIGTAVEAVRRVDDALADIVSDVNEVHGLLGGMAEDNRAQSTAISELSVAANTLDTTIQQNTAMVEETSAAARTLSAEAATLDERASRFRVDGGNGRGQSARPNPHRGAQAMRTHAPLSSAPRIPSVPPGAANADGAGEWASF